MTTNKKECETKKFRKYNIQLEQIQRIHYQDPKVNELIKNNQPVLITNSSLVKSACEKWNTDFFEKYLGKINHTVYLSNDHNFKYFDEKKVLSETNPKGVEFTPKTRRLDMEMSEFIKKVKEWKSGDERLYLQHTLNATMGNAIVADYVKFDWRFAGEIRQKNNWGELTSNVLFISMEGNVTPCHYDEQQNLFAQIQGYKRCILFPPNQFECLYPHPVYHPHDRQSMVDFDKPDYSKYPKFKDVKGCETVIGPGDVLYIPIYWWHHVESSMEGGPTITVNFWYKVSTLFH
nr:hypoxia-inducible factor 1-alpha inhibitor-like [Leptinotarsa decemlineata]